MSDSEQLQQANKTKANGIQQTAKTLLPMLK